MDSGDKIMKKKYIDREKVMQASVHQNKLSTRSTLIQNGSKRGVFQRGGSSNQKPHDSKGLITGIYK
jgi:hypothetical protein